MYFKDMKQIWIAKYNLSTYLKMAWLKNKGTYMYYTFPEWYYLSKTGLYRVQNNSYMEF